MKYLVQILVVFVVISLSATYAQKNFGIGVILGEPTGLSAKLYTGSNNAFDFAAAWSFKGNGNLLLQADYVWHSSLTRASSGELMLYYGIGGRVIFQDDPRFGARIPVGLDYQFTSAPIDIFLELVPILDFVPSTNFNLGGGIGVRFWL
ncbi:MAG: hypothetical protein OQK57_03740 [Ignavibacteriaceae bacterium]|nr:hypothetical protein [Ignavibacteriaceae bacterium]